MESEDSEGTTEDGADDSETSDTSETDELELDFNTESTSDETEEEVTEESLNIAGNTALTEGTELSESDELEEGRLGDAIKKLGHKIGTGIKDAAKWSARMVQKGAGVADRVNAVFGKDNKHYEGIVDDSLLQGYAVYQVKSPTTVDTDKSQPAVEEYLKAIRARGAVNNDALLDAFYGKSAIEEADVSKTIVNDYDEAIKACGKSAHSANGPTIVMSAANIAKFGDLTSGGSQQAIVAIYVDGKERAVFGNPIGDLYISVVQEKIEQNKIDSKIEQEEAQSIDLGKITGSFLYTAIIADDNKIGSNIFSDLETAITKAAELSKSVPVDVNVVAKDAADKILATCHKGKANVKLEEVKALLPEEADSGAAADETVESMAASENILSLNEMLSELDEETMNTHISDYLTSIYENVLGFTTTTCNLTEDGLLVEGYISYVSGKTLNTTFSFKPTSLKENTVQFIGKNSLIAEGDIYQLTANIKDSKLLTESLSYNYTIGEDIIQGNK